MEPDNVFFVERFSSQRLLSEGARILQGVFFLARFYLGFCRLLLVSAVGNDEKSDVGFWSRLPSGLPNASHNSAATSSASWSM
mgnify:CR=1 FL=1